MTLAGVELLDGDRGHPFVQDAVEGVDLAWLRLS
jgi:hypothetical protein